MLVYTCGMNSNLQPHHILQEIAAIERMERGKLSIIRQGPNGPYYNFQHRQDGRNLTEYVPADQVPLLQAHIESHQRFEALVDQYARLITEQTRAERKASLQKKRPTRKSPSPKKPRSSP